MFVIVYALFGRIAFIEQSHMVSHPDLWPKNMRLTSLSFDIQKYPKKANNSNETQHGSGSGKQSKNWKKNKTTKIKVVSSHLLLQLLQTYLQEILWLQRAPLRKRTLKMCQLQFQYLWHNNCQPEKWIYFLAKVDIVETAMDPGGAISNNPVSLMLIVWMLPLWIFLKIKPSHWDYTTLWKHSNQI